MEKSIVFRLWLALVGGGLVVLPLFYWPRATVPFEIPKVWFLMGWVFMISVFATLIAMTTTMIGHLGKVHLMVGIWFLILVAASLLGVDPAKSFLGNYWRWDGLISVASLLCLFFTLSLFSSTKWLRWAILGMALGNIVSSLWAMAQMIFDKGIGFESFGAGFGQPVFLSGYLIVTTPFVWFWVDQIKTKTAKIICFLMVTMIIVTGLWATKTLISLACLPILLVGLLVIKKKIDWRWAAILGIICLSIVVVNYQRQMENGERIGSGVVYEGRERLFRKAYLAFWERPILGWGVANFDKAFEAVDWPIKINNDIYADKAHSNLVEMAVTSGLLGLGSYLLLLGFVLKRLVCRHDKEGKFLLLTLVVYLIHSQTNVTSVAEEVVFWIVVASS